MNILSSTLPSKDLTQKKLCCSCYSEATRQRPQKGGSFKQRDTTIPLTPKNLQNEATRQRPHKGGSFKQSPTLPPNQICCSCYGEATRQRPQKGGSFKQTDAYHLPILQCTLYKMNGIINQSTLSLWTHHDQVRVLYIQWHSHDFLVLIHQKDKFTCMCVSTNCMASRHTW